MHGNWPHCWYTNTTLHQFRVKAWACYLPPYSTHTQHNSPESSPGNITTRLSDMLLLVVQVSLLMFFRDGDSYWGCGYLSRLGFCESGLMVDKNIWTNVPMCMSNKIIIKMEHTFALVVITSNSLCCSSRQGCCYCYGTACVWRLRAQFFNKAIFWPWCDNDVTVGGLAGMLLVPWITAWVTGIHTFQPLLLLCFV